jgi:hypothetical protein
MSFDRCLSLLSLQDKLPVLDIRDVAKQYQKSENLTYAQALERAVTDHLEHARAEEAHILRTVSEHYETRTGQKTAPQQSAGERMRARVKEENPFLSFLSEHGIHVDERSDTGGESARSVMVPGYGALYRKSGLRMDELAHLAHEAGFLSDHDVSNPADNGGTRKLADMIERAAHRKEIIPRADAAQDEPHADDALMAEAQRLGIETAGKSADQVYDEVVAAHADSFTDHEAQLAADAARDADIPLDGGKPFDNLTDEDIDAIFGIRAANDTAAGGGKIEGDTATPAGARAGEAGAAGEPGTRGESVDERKDDPYTRDLFGGQDLFDDIPVRPGTVEAQKATARAAVSDLARRLGIDRINRGNHDQGSDVSVLGSRLLSNFIEGKPNQLVGQEAKTPADLAALAQVYRDPRFETFRVFYTDRAGKIVGEAGYTSRLPAAVTMPPDLLHQMQADKSRFGASGYYLLHNHPSGSSAPSHADINMTRHVDQHLPGFLGHVVIDHNEYSVIHNWGEQTIPAPHLNGRDFTGMPEMQHQMLGVKITSPEAVARAAKALQIPDGHATMIMTAAGGKTQLLVDIPMATLERAKTGDDFTRVKAMVRRMSRAAGAGGHRFIVLPEGSDIAAPVFRRMLGHGVVTDVVNADGRSLQNEGSYSGGDFMRNLRGKSIRITEPVDPYGQRQDGDRREAARGAYDRRTIEVDGVRHPIRDTQGRLIGGGDFMKQQEFWRGYKGEVDERGRPILPDDTDLAAHEPSADYESEQPEVPPSAREKLAKLIGRPVAQLRSVAHDLVSLVNPMAVGADKAKAIAKDFANNMRTATAQWNAFDAVLRKNYTESDLRKMWEAADQENDLRREGKTSDKAGLNSLPDDQRETVEVLHQYGQNLWDRAKRAGLIDPDSEGVAYWTPRVAANIYADGGADALRPQAGEFSKEAKNLRTSASSTKRRMHETTAESEAALKAKLGEDAAYVKNIRVMPMAMAQLEKAIAGRTLVNQIKSHGQAVGQELISEHGGPGFVTFDHPALKRWIPKTDWQPVDEAKIAERGYEVKPDGVYADDAKLKTYRVKDGEVQQLRPMLDSEGKPVLLPAPLFVHKDFAGPLRAVFTSSLGNETVDRVYRGMMALKGASMSMIMASPMTHNLVIWGKAMPSLISSMGWKSNLKNIGTLGAYTYNVGHQYRQDHALFTDLVKGGLVPVGGRGMNPDAASIAEGLKPGRSLLAKALGAVLDPVSEKAGDAARRGVDAAGHFWHETLLWDRIGDMQVGMAVQLRNHFMDAGVDQYAATRIATFFANRYAGAVPQEAMSQGAHALLNTMLFSKSFTMTNLGAMKDPIVGLPSDVRAQIKEHYSALNRALGKTDIEAVDAAGKVLKQAQAVTRKKAGMILMADFGAMAIVTSLMQAWMNGDDGKKFTNDLRERAGKLGAKLDKENPLSFLGPTWGKAGLPLAALRHPFDNLEMLSQTHDNPHGKQDRIRIGEDEHGNSYYMRLPVGKVVEEMKSYLNLSSATDLVNGKASPLAKGVVEAYNNRDFFGRTVYDKDANLLVQAAQVAGHIIKSQAPFDDMVALKNIVSGDRHQGGKVHMLGTDLDMDQAKLMGTATGLSVSKLTGGDALAEMRYTEREQRDRVNNIMPDVRDSVLHGDTDKAVQMMEKAGMDQREIMQTLNNIKEPGNISKGRMRKFQQHATDEEIGRLDKMMNRK